MVVGWEAKAISQQMKPIRKKTLKKKERERERERNMGSVCLISRGDSKDEPMNSVSGFPRAACYQEHSWTSLVAQWIRICLPMRGTWIWFLVWGDSTWHGTTKPVHHNYWVHILEPPSHNCWAHKPQLLKPRWPRSCLLQQKKLPWWEASGPYWRVAPACLC